MRPVSSQAAERPGAPCAWSARLRLDGRAARAAHRHGSRHRSECSRARRAAVVHRAAGADLVALPQRQGAQGGEPRAERRQAGVRDVLLVRQGQRLRARGPEPCSTS